MNVGILCLGCGYETVDTHLRFAKILTLVDLDADGDLDIASADDGFSSTLLNTGDAHFFPPDLQELPGVAAFLDVTGDDLPDALLGDEGRDCPGTSIAIGRAGRFGAEQCLSLQDDVVSADITGDGARELMFSQQGSLFVLPRAFQGLDAPEEWQWVFRSGESATRISLVLRDHVCDFDGNGTEDFFALDGDNILLMTSALDGSITAHPTPLDPTAVSTASGDVDNDGDDDVVQSDIAGRTNVRVFKNHGNATFADAELVAIGDSDFANNGPDSVTDIVVVDFDVDNRNDIVALVSPSFGQPNGSVVLGIQNGFSPRLQEEDFLGIGGIAHGDVDGDGIDDFVAASDEGKLRLYLSSR